MIKPKRKLKICLAASGGGHLTQLLKTRPAWEQYDKVFVTTSDIVGQELAQLGPVYVVGDCDRSRPILSVKVFFSCLRVALTHKFDAIISTGAAPGCMMCLLAKLRGAKIIWIDSIANVEKLSMSGRLTSFAADLFLVQWPGLARKYAFAHYWGNLL